MAERIDRDELRAAHPRGAEGGAGRGLCSSPVACDGEGDHAEHGGGGGHKRRVRHSPPPPPSAVPLPRFAGEEPASSLAAGVLTEAMVTELAAGHRRIVIGGEVVVTPLARDRARELKVEIVRQKP